MDFDFTDDVKALQDTVSKWVERGYPSNRRQALVEKGGKSREVYNELAELGLTALLVPEEFEGMEMGAVEAMVVAEELGRGLVIAPYIAAALVVPTLLKGAPHNVQAECLPGIADGSSMIVPALQERKARYINQFIETTAVSSGDQFILNGQKSVVPAADEADGFVVTARLSGDVDDINGIGIFLIDATSTGVRIDAYQTQDGGRAGELMLKDVSATLISANGWELMEEALDVGIAALCAEGVGVMDEMAKLTADYLKTRKQFGVPLASFQALQHNIADVTIQRELGRSMSYFATMKLNEAASERRRAISQSKVQLGRSMRLVGQTCIQLHGGIGITDEYIASHYFKRLSVIEMTYGDTLHHLGEVSKQMKLTAGVHV